MCDRFHHLDRSVLMNILIISLNARACWVSSRPPFPEINMGKFGRGGKALLQGLRFSFDAFFSFAYWKTNLDVCVT